MNSWVFAGLIASPLLLALGQMLFKMAATATPLVSIASTLDLLRSPIFIAALVVYAVATLVWIYVLSNQSLSRAYPFVALSFVFTPLLAHFVLAEPLDAKYIVGAVLLIAGVVVIGT